MDGSRRRTITTERPIAKPDFPLPSIFCPSKLSERPTRRRNEPQPINERAHFFVKDMDENGRPTYGFVITAESADRELAN